MHDTSDRHSVPRQTVRGVKAAPTKAVKSRVPNSFSILVLQSLAKSGMGCGAVAAMLGEPGAFVDAVLSGRRKLGRRHLRNIEAATGSSAASWALKGIDRSRLNFRGRRAAAEAADLLGQFDSAIAEIAPLAKR
jgi:hypothetical protein